MTTDPSEAVAASLGLGDPVLEHASDGRLVAVRPRQADGALFVCVVNTDGEGASMSVSPVEAELVLGLRGHGEGWCAAGALPDGAVAVRAEGAATALADATHGAWLLVAERDEPHVATFVDPRGAVVARRRLMLQVP